MHRYRVWIRINEYQTAHVEMYADNDWAVKSLAEAQYGQGNVLNYTQIDEQQSWPQ